MLGRPDVFQVIFNHDGFGILAELIGGDMTEADAATLLVEPLAEAAVNTIDWCILTTGEHNCRLPHGYAFDGEGIGRRSDADIGRVVAHYNAAELDLLDIVIKHGHLSGMKVWGNIRLNHCLNIPRLQACPGKTQDNETGCCGRKDFRDVEFQGYLLDLVGDLVEKGVDGVSLDFERKEPFFPNDAPQSERFAACTRFLQMARKLTTLPICARVSYESAKGEPQGQKPAEWLQQGLLDVIVPATHNHEPDSLDWYPAGFLEAAAQSPRPCLVCPQIWPTADVWGENDTYRRHLPAALSQRVSGLKEMQAHGVYFFNFFTQQIVDVFR